MKRERIVSTVGNVMWKIILAVFLLMSLASVVHAAEIENPSVDVSVTAAPAPKRGLIKEGKYYYFYQKGMRLRNCWKRIDGYRYYFKSNGKAAIGAAKIKGKYYIFGKSGRLCTPKRNYLMSINGRKYYVSPNGNPVPGWHVIRKKLYYVYQNGRCAANTKRDGIIFTAEACAKNNVQTKLKIKCMQVISKVTNSGMSKSQKLRACWYYMNTIHYQPWKYPDTTKKYWPQQCALDMLDTMGGNCYGFANAFAALAKELGYTPYVIEIPKCHCWVRIDGLYWDNMGNQMGTISPRMSYKKDQIYKF